MDKQSALAKGPGLATAGLGQGDRLALAKGAGRPVCRAFAGEQVRGPLGCSKLKGAIIMTGKGMSG
jgi:hypothetical protein